ncbi:MAG: hypothetical protein RLZZ628_1487 [Bacteroidota bacterium]|jgi:hypothetical protein
MKKFLFLMGFISILSTPLLTAQVSCTPPVWWSAMPGVDGCSVIWRNYQHNSLFTVRYRVATDSIWSEATAQANAIDTLVTFRLTRLQACQDYVYQIRSVCAGVNSAFTDIGAFKTFGCNSECPSPTDLAAYSRDSAAILYWGGAATQYQVQYRAIGTDAFTSVTVSAPNATITGLQPCTYYECKVKAICPTASSNFTSITRFKTRGCGTTSTCGVPRITALSVTGNSVVASWVNTGTATYEVRYKKATDSLWTTVNTQGNTFTIGNLATCTAYQFKIRSICNTNVYSEFSVSGSIMTGNCTPASYCAAPRRLNFTMTNTTAVLRWDSTGATSYEVQWMTPQDSAWRTVSASTNRLELTGLTACTIYQFRVRANCSATNYAYSSIARFATTGCVSSTCALPTDVRVYTLDTMAVVSWNPNGAPYFRVQYKSATDSLWTTVSVNTGLAALTGLMRCKAYQVRLQSACTNGASSVYTEPIRFETRGCRVPVDSCAYITNVGVISSDATNVAIRWNPNIGNTYRIMYYTTDNTANFITRTLSDTMVRLTNLVPCKNYIFRIACGNTTALQWSEIQFNTITNTCVSNCAAPTDLFYTPTKDSLTWHYTGNYATIRWRRADTTVWSYDSTHWVSGYSFGGKLQPCQNYICQIQSICPTEMSVWSAEFAFRAKGTSCATEGGTNSYQIRDFGIYPNPGKDVVQVLYKLEQAAQSVRLDLVDLQGKIIRQLDGGQQDIGNYIQSYEGLESLNLGLYLIVLRVDGKVARTQKWVKE